MLEPVIFDTLCSAKSARQDTTARTDMDRSADIPIHVLHRLKLADRNVRAPVLT
jgi:hypothetical protein